MAAVTARPAAVLGMHFFSPANVMKLLEVVRGAKTGASELATVMELAPRIGKVAVVSGGVPGVHRQPHADPAPAAGAGAADGRRGL